MICTTLYTCSFILPPPAAAWCCSCCSPGPAAGCASVGSQPQCESHSAPCSAAPPHTHLCLPKTSTISTLSNSCTTHNWLELKTCVSAFNSQWISWCFWRSPSSSPSDSSAPQETPQSETWDCRRLPLGYWHPPLPGPDTHHSNRQLMSSHCSLSAPSFQINTEYYLQRWIKCLHLSHIPVSESFLRWQFSTLQCSHF